jgi:hypothetical protein
MTTLVSLVGWLLLAISFPLSAVAAVLDPDKPTHVVLQQIAPSLDIAGIDVILGRSMDFAPSERPRVAQLNGFTGQSGWEWAKYPKDVWVSGFEKGLIGALMAVPRDASAPIIDKETQRCAAIPAPKGDPICEFLRLWLDKNAQGKRIFIAFTRNDQSTALAVQSALESQGYATFMYLRDGDKDPWAHPDFVGEIFAHADDRLVIDTLNSRGSEGVHFEATCADLLRPVRTPKDTRYMDFIKRTPPPS